jgi:predicted aspartyl protease
MPEAVFLNESKRLKMAALGVLLFNIALFPISSMADSSPLRVYPLLKSQFPPPPSKPVPLPALPGSPTPWQRQATQGFTSKNTFLDAPVQVNTACKLTLEAKLPMTENLGHYTVPVNIGGQTHPMLIDTGAEGAAILPKMADEWNLRQDTSSASRVKGVGGVSSQYLRIIPRLTLGSSEWVDLRVAALPFLSPEQLAQASPPVGMLGANVLNRYDVEFDFPARTVSLYTASGCLGTFVPWKGDFQAYSAQKTPSNRFILKLSLNGHPVRALLDTGSTSSVVTTAAAGAAGVDSVALSLDPRSTGSGSDGLPVTTYQHKFDMKIGTASFDNAPLVVADIALKDSDMMLGMDFMRYRRVWVSYSTGWVFMQLATEKT